MRMIGESTTNKHVYTRCHKTKQKQNNIVNTNQSMSTYRGYYHVTCPFIKVRYCILQIYSTSNLQTTQYYDSPCLLQFVMMISHGLQQKQTILTEEPPEDVQNSPYTKVDDPLKKLTSTTDCSTEIVRSFFILGSHIYQGFSKHKCRWSTWVSSTDSLQTALNKAFYGVSGSYIYVLC